MKYTRQEYMTDIGNIVRTWMPVFIAIITVAMTWAYLDSKQQDHERRITTLESKDTVLIQLQIDMATVKNDIASIKEAVRAK